MFKTKFENAKITLKIMLNGSNSVWFLQSTALSIFFYDVIEILLIEKKISLVFPYKMDI